MEDKNIKYWVLGSIVLMILVFMGLFELKKVPKMHNEGHYDINSKEPYGLYAFHQLLLQHFDGKVKIEDQFDLNNMADTNKVLMLFSSSNASYDKLGSENLINFVRRGNDLIIINNSFEIKDSTGTQWVTTRTLEPKELYIDSIYYPFEKGYAHYMIQNYADTMILEPLMECIVDSTTYAPFFGYFEIEENYIYLHNNPLFFTNQMSRDSFYLPHFKELVRWLNHKDLVIAKTTKQGAHKNDNKFKHILSNKALSTAFYVMIGLLVVLLWLGTKRKMRPIDVYNPKKNTSLEYLDTLVKLYDMQDQNISMIRIIEQNFYHDIYRQLAITADHPDFNNLVAKKLKVDIKNVAGLRDLFTTIKKEGICHDKTLIALNYKIEKLFKNNDNGRHI